MCFIYFDQHGWLLGGYCQEGYYFLRLYKKRNKSATLRLLDVLATLHAKCTTKRIRRGNTDTSDTALFREYLLLIFGAERWSSIKLRADVPEPRTLNRRKKKVCRMMQYFSEAQASNNIVPNGIGIVRRCRHGRKKCNRQGVFCKNGCQSRRSPFAAFCFSKY